MGPVEEVSAQAMARLPEKNPNPSPLDIETRDADQLALQLSACVQPGKQAQTRLHQLHPHSDAPRIPTTPLLLACAELCIAESRELRVRAASCIAHRHLPLAVSAHS